MIATLCEDYKIKDDSDCETCCNTEELINEGTDERKARKIITILR